MRRALQFITEHSRSASLILTVFLSVSMMLMGDSSKARFARSVTTAIFNTGRFTLSWGISMFDLGRENKRLRLQNLELSDQLHYNTTAIRENKRLRRLLGFKQRFSLTNSVIVATVVGYDVDRIVNSLILDVGTNDGVRKNMAVVTAAGLVGKINECYLSSSSVQIIKDANSDISAIVENRDIRGLVSWRGNSDLVMYGLLRQRIPEPGEKVYTTGIGGVFPTGLFVGTVTGELVSDVELYASVSVKPAVDFSRIHEVFILRGSERSDIWNDGDGGGHFVRPEIQ